VPSASNSRRIAPEKTDFSIVNLIRGLIAEPSCNSKGDIGQTEASAVGTATRQLANHSSQQLRGHVIPLERGVSGGINTGTFSDGGALVSGSLTLASALQPVLQLERLGARRSNQKSGDLLVGAPVSAGGGWVVENNNIAVSMALLATGMREPKEAAARIQISRRLMTQSTIAEAEFRALLERTLRQTIETGILSGDGSNGQPLGMSKDGQLSQRSYNGGPGSLPSEGEVADFIGELLDGGADLDSVQILAAGEDYADSATLIKIDNGVRRIAGAKCAFTPYLPSGCLLIADWSRVVIGYVGEPQLVINPYTYSESGVLELTLFQSVGYAVERRELFTVAKFAA
jgi:hypothetical protein